MEVFQVKFVFAISQLESIMVLHGRELHSVHYTMYLLVIFQQSSVFNQAQYVVHLLEMG